MRERVTADGHDRTRSLGWLAVAWIEAHCVHGPGDVQGDPVLLDDEFTEFVVDVYAVDAAGRRLYDSAFLSRAKGRAKSELAGFLVLFEAMGPCRFDRFARGGEVYRWRDFEHRFQAGEPMGRPVTAPFIRCLATEEQQSGNTYDVVYFNLTEGPLGEGLPSDAAGLTRTFLPDGGEIRPSTSGNASKDGGKETFSVFDESHLYVLPELRRMYDTVRRNLAKRRDAQPWSLETSTMYLPGEDSVAERSHQYARAILAGEARTARLLFDHREGTADVDLEDEDDLRSALAEAYGPFFEVMDVDRLLSEIWDHRNDPQASRRFFLNQATSASDSWVAAYEWTAIVDASKVVSPRDPVVLGFDGSRRRARGVTDATALIGCRVSDGHLFEVDVWEEPSGAAGKNWEVPVAEVDTAVRGAFRRWNVVGMYCDPAKWESYVAAWEAEFGRHLKVKAQQQHPCHWWMTGGHAPRIVKAVDQLHGAIVNGEVTHDGSTRLTRHVLNARRRPSRAGVQIAKEHPDSPQKIDAAVAAVLAYQARLDALAKGVGVRRAGGRARRLA